MLHELAFNLEEPQGQRLVKGYRVCRYDSKSAQHAKT